MLYAIAKALIYAGARLFWRVRVTGAQNVPAHGPVIIACNHVSLVDPPVLGACCPRTIRYMAKRQLFAVPLLGPLIRALGAFPVDREGSAAGAIKRSVEVLRAGEAIGIFPEGGRNPRGEAQVRQGVALLASLSHAPVVPAAIVGSGSALRCGSIEVVFGCPMQLEAGRKATRDDLAKFTDAVMGEIDTLGRKADSAQRVSGLNRWALPVMLFVGLLLRLAYIGAQGFPNDIAAFQSWALTLVAHGPSGLYANTSFLDYPPGYFYILGFIGWIWTHVVGSAHDPGYGILAMLVKLPAIFFDLGIGALVYTLARRFGSERLALWAAALYLINPAIIFVSALWGQVDSVACFFALFAVYALMRSDDEETGAATAWIVCGWLSFAYSLLVKPQAAVMLPFLLAFAFTNPARRVLRLRATAYALLGALALVILLVEPFHPSNPIAALAWLFERLAYGTNVYQFNSVNAFNIWVLHVPWNAGSGAFWQPDGTPIFGLAQATWGVVLVLVALALLVWRYVQVQTPQALLEGCAIALLAFFTLATRMHERYIYDGVVFTIACLPIAKRYLWVGVTLSTVFWLNLIYSYQYIALMTSHAPSGADPHNLWGPATTVLALVNVATFFYLGYVYLGSAADEPVKARSTLSELGTDFFGRIRAWFDPHEGLAVLRKPLDLAVMWSLGVASFVLSLAIPHWYWKPTGTECWTVEGGGGTHCGIFDETYFGRAAEEYLKNLRIYENTHPPLSKLLITFSTMLFGGMPKGHGLGGWTFLNAIIGHFPDGDNPAGWRFLDVVFGAVAIMVLYAFAKRVTGSTIWAAVAAGFFLFDGMHYVQSRLATPEGFVIVFSLTAVYAFYRFWIASQTGVRPHLDVRWPVLAAGAGASLACGIVTMLVFDWLQHAVLHWPWFVWWMGLDVTHGPGAIEICSVYFALVYYWIFRYKVAPSLFASGKREVTFPEGSFALQEGAESEMHTIDGGIVSKGKTKRGAFTQSKGGALVYDDDDLEVTYGRDRVTYATAAGTGTYAGGVARAGGNVEDGRTARRWLIIFSLALGCLVSTKWYGIMGFGVSFLVVFLIWLQGRLSKGRPLLWGNPRAFYLDGIIVTIILVSMTIYGLVWVPDMARQAPDPNEIHNVNDVVFRQYSMFDYHYTLRATHPYSSKWFEWPFDYVPVAYYYVDHRSADHTQSDPNKKCCIYEVTSMPNPFTLWFGLLCVPIVGVLAWRERNKGYALLIITYLLQWLPWAKSPRLAWEYHFYVDIPLICLCNAIVLQRVWAWADAYGKSGNAKDARLVMYLSRAAVVGVTCAIVGAFIFFFPILSAWPLSYNAWHARMWLPTWIIGPG